MASPSSKLILSARLEEIQDLGCCGYPEREEEGTTQPQSGSHCVPQFNSDWVALRVP